MKIVQITAGVEDDRTFIYGIGNDQRVYAWSTRQGKWIPYGPSA